MTSKPRSIRFRAMGRPITPRPITPTRCIAASLPPRSLARDAPLLPVVGAGAQADPDPDAALVEPPLVQLERAQPVPDERVAVGDLPGRLLVGGPQDRHSRAGPGARSRQQRPGGQQHVAPLQVEQPGDVFLDTGRDGIRTGGGPRDGTNQPVVTPEQPGQIDPGGWLLAARHTSKLYAVLGWRQPLTERKLYADLRLSGR